MEPGPEAGGTALVPGLHLISSRPLTSHLTSSCSFGPVNATPLSNTSAPCVSSLSSSLSESSDKVSVSSPVTCHHWGELPAMALKPELVLVFIEIHFCSETVTLSSMSGQFMQISSLHPKL